MSRFFKQPDSPREDSRSLYLQVGDELERRIRSGSYSVGTKLPREVDLCSEFGVSRTTIREALRLLEMQGVIVRKQRAGTIVARIDLSPPKTAVVDPAFSMDELVRNTKLEIVESSKRTIPANLFGFGETPIRGKWLYYAGIRRAESDGSPLSLTEIYIHPKFKDIEPLIGAQGTRVYQLIEKYSGEKTERVRTRIVPWLLSETQAERLQADVHSLAMRLVHRATSRSNELLQVGIGTYPVDRFSFELLTDIS